MLSSFLTRNCLGHQPTTVSCSQAALMMQVVGCNKDLASQKAYFQRYGICEEHLKLSSLLKDGVQQRFCQICNRFHLLADFDGNRRCAFCFPHELSSTCHP